MLKHKHLILKHIIRRSYFEEAGSAASWKGGILSEDLGIGRRKKEKERKKECECETNFISLLIAFFQCNGS